MYDFIFTFWLVFFGIAGPTFPFLGGKKRWTAVLLAGGIARSDRPDSYMKASLSFASEESKGSWDAVWENPNGSWANVAKVWE